MKFTRVYFQQTLQMVPDRIWMDICIGKQSFAVILMIGILCSMIYPLWKSLNSL